MDILKTAREIGLFESSINIAAISESNDIITRVGAVMPLPSSNMMERVKGAAEWLLSFNKSKYMFLTPELALIDSMGTIADREIEAIITVPCDIDPESRNRMVNNLPHTIKVSLMEEPFFPDDFYPCNGILVVCGYCGGGRPMMLPDTYRMFEHYCGFFGKKVFVPYISVNQACRYGEWLEIDQTRLNAVWRED